MLKMLFRSSPLISAVNASLSRCIEEEPVYPIEMNTLPLIKIGGPTSAKSIMSEKHVYGCVSGNSIVPNKIKEVITFTSLFEQTNSSKSAYMATTCVKDILSARVNSYSVTFNST